MSKGNNSKRKAGGNANNVAKCKQYADHHVREKNKLKRILQSNGAEFARQWATKYNALNILETVSKGRRIKPRQSFKAAVIKALEV